MAALWAGPLVVLFTGDCPARRGGLERSFFCLENENRVWYAQDFSPAVNDEWMNEWLVLMHGSFGRNFKTMAAREELSWWYGSSQRVILILVIWYLRKQPVDRFGKGPLSQKT